jgi:hypothetical protein
MDLIGAAWRTSSHSGGNGGTCVEVAARLPRVIAVRDSKNPGGAALAFGTAAWQDFTDGIRSGEPTTR